MEPNEKFLFTNPPSALLTPLPLIPFTTEEIIGCGNEVAKGAKKAGRNYLFGFIFYVLLCQ